MLFAKQVQQPKKVDLCFSFSMITPCDVLISRCPLRFEDPEGSLSGGAIGQTPI